MIEQKFKKGDKVKIIGYGHLGWYSSIESLNEYKNFFKKMNNDFKDYLLWGKEVVENVPTILPKEDYSHLVLDNKNGIIIDESPELVGKEGIVEGSYADLYAKGSLNDRDYKIYSIKGIPEKVAWYDEIQLGLV